MDENISYDRAWEAVNTSVRFEDVSTLEGILQRFPVLQVSASRQLIRHIATCRLINASEKSRLVRTTVDQIGCIVAPCGLLTAECKLCATTLFYGIQAFNHRFLQNLVRRMIVAKRDCGGCGLFVHVALSETLHQLGKLPDFVKDLFPTDDLEQFGTDIHSWKEVRDMLRREGVLKSADESPVAELRASSLVRKERIRRLRLSTEGINKVCKKRKREVSTPVRNSSGALQSRNEKYLLLKLVTMYTVCPDFVARKIRSHGLKSYCSAKVLSMHGSLVTSRRSGFTTDELQGINLIGSKKFDPSPHNALVKINKFSKDVTLFSTVTPGSQIRCQNDADPTDLSKNAYKVWMPLVVGIQNLVQAVQQGQVSIDAILNMWTSARDKFLSSMDQIVIAGLAHEGILENLIGQCLSGEHRTSVSGRTLRMSDTPGLSALGTIRECFQMLDVASERGIGYPTQFWEQLVKAFAVLEGALVPLLLRAMHETGTTDVSRVIMHSRNIERRLQDRVEYRRTEPKTTAAVLRVCDCLSVEMKWKDKRRLRSSVWKACRCMIPNTMFLPVPRPELWFSWVICMSTSSGESRSFAQKANSAMKVSLWLYGNPAWRNRQYNYSKLDILHGIVRSVLRDECGNVASEIEGILAVVLKDAEVRNVIFSEFAKCSKAALPKSRESSEKLLEAQLRLIRTGIEKMWSMVGHESKLSLFRLHAGISSQEVVLMENFLTTVGDCSKSMHDCIRDMPKLCEYIAAMYRLLLAQEEAHGDLMRVKIIAGLIWHLRGKGRFAGRDSQRRDDPILEKVMLCFE